MAHYMILGNSLLSGFKIHFVMELKGDELECF